MLKRPFTDVQIRAKIAANPFGVLIYTVSLYVSNAAALRQKKVSGSAAEIILRHCSRGNRVYSKMFPAFKDTGQGGQQRLVGALTTTKELLDSLYFFVF
jgi:hypothetical protein